MTAGCPNCAALAARVAGLEKELAASRCSLEEVTAYAAQQHEKVADLCRTVEQLTTGRSSHEGNYG